MSNADNQLDLVGTQLGQTIGGLPPISAVAVDTTLPAWNPPVARVAALVADGSGTEGSYLKVYDTQTSIYVIDASISATGDIAPGMDVAEFATNIATYLDTNKALFGTPTISDDGGYVTVTWPPGVGQNRWVFSTDDPVLGIGPLYVDIASAGTSVVNERWPLVTAGILGGRVNYMLGPLQLYWDTNRWLFYDGNDGSEYYFSSDDVSSPDQVTTWEVGTDGTGPVPTVTAYPLGADAETGSVTAEQVTGVQTAYLTTDFPKTNDTLTAVTGWSKEITLEAGHVYQVTGQFYQTGTTGEIGGKYDFAGGTATATAVEGIWAYSLSGFSASPTWTRISALDTSLLCDPSNVNDGIEFGFTIEVNAGGTLIPQFAQSAADLPTVTLNKYSTITVTEIG